MQSIASVVQSVQMDLQKLNDQNTKDLLSNLANGKISHQTLTEQKSSLSDKKFNTNKDDKQLKLQKKIHATEGFLSEVKKRMQQNLSGARNNSNDNHDVKRRVSKILSDLDSYSTDSIESHTQGDSAAVALPSANAQALQAAVAGKHMARTQQSQAQKSGFDQQKNMHEQSASLVQKQLSALKKSKFFGTLFSIIKPVVSAAIQAVVSLIASPIVASLVQKCTDLLMQIAESEVMKGFQKRISKAQNAEQNIQQNTLPDIQQNANSQQVTAQEMAASFDKAQKALEA